tara:strand:+ start:2158 stop:2442 length:285 start_codon:yes stop_codon:yes gene_type:complete
LIGQLTKKEKKIMAQKKPEIPVAFTKKSLAEKVCLLVHTDGLKYSEALLEICEQHEIDPHDIAKLVKGPLKAKLEAEAMRYNVIPNTQGNSLFV